MKRSNLALATLIAAASLSACQTYDFVPVTPFAYEHLVQVDHLFGHQLKPNVMMVIDRSGSMNDPTTNCGLPTCTRMTELQSAMDAFLMANSTVARLGLSVFPADTMCTATTNAEVLVPMLPDAQADDDAALNLQSSKVKSQVDLLQAKGGTPTGGSLQYVAANIEQLRDSTRENFVLLLTDGLPNCNAANPNTCAAPAACQCTLGDGGCDTTYCTLGCLDSDGSVAAIQGLKNQGVETIVVGFGADVMGADGYATLDAMAEAGKFPYQCKNDADCGTGDTCDTSLMQPVCGRSHFFQAANGTQLAAQLGAISGVISESMLCNRKLNNPPTDPSLLAVSLFNPKTGDVPLDRCASASGCDGWTYDDTVHVVTIQGAACQKLENSTPVDPIDVRISELVKL